MENKEFYLEDAIALTALKFRGKIDKAGLPYIEHCIRVMMSGDTIEEKMGGVLHDIIEDTDVTIEDLLEMGVTPTVIEAVNIVTKRKKETYDDFITRIIKSRNNLAKRIKLNDLNDNSNPTRLLYLGSIEAERLAIKYAVAKRRLMYEV